MGRRMVISLANESIAFQAGKFGEEIQLAIDVYLDKKNEVALYNYLSELIKRHTKLNVLVRKRKGKLENFFFGLPAAAFSKDFIIGHVFNNETFKEVITDELTSLTKSEIDKAQKEFKENLNSTVDLKTAKVSGIFAERECEIIFEPDGFLELGINSAEMTAIFLHEVGHIFTMYEFANRLNKTNQALTFISRLLMEKAPIEKLKYNFELIGDKLVNDDKVFDGLEKIEDTTVISTVIIDKIRKHASSELGLPEYDLTTSEYLADQFASRQGYGKELVTGLHKVKIAFGSNDIYTDDCYAQEIFGMICLAAFPLTFGLVVGFTASIVIATLTIISSGYNNKDYTYDTARTRYLRIREQLIERIKNKKSVGSDTKQILEDIETIDKCISEVKGFESLWTKINTFFFKKNKNMKDIIELQRDLEELSSNDLFIKSAKLKLI